MVLVPLGAPLVKNCRQHSVTDICLGFRDDEKPALVALLVLLPLSAHAEVFRCVVNGKTTFQDFPCAGVTSERVNTNSINIISAPTYQAPKVANTRPQQRSSSNNTYQSWTDRRNAETRSRPRLDRGMPQQRVYDVYGSPHSRSSVMRDGHTCERFIWNNPRSYSGTYTAIVCDQKYILYMAHTVNSYFL
ncbi:DUF4124 domain-containing protein [Vreelandella stevensii]|uniref:DUF4124 domain-containing protein n=1 Tax=Vreelandella stevensii TaxID=502821 RepID=UPI00403B1383